MTRVFNCSAGPATLPDEVLRLAAADLRELLTVPANCKVLPARCCRQGAACKVLPASCRRCRAVRRSN